MVHILLGLSAFLISASPIHSTSFFSKSSINILKIRAISMVNLLFTRVPMTSVSPSCDSSRWLGNIKDRNLTLNIFLCVLFFYQHYRVEVRACLCMCVRLRVCVRGCVRACAHACHVHGFTVKLYTLVPASTSAHSITIHCALFTGSYWCHAHNTVHNSFQASTAPGQRRILRWSLSPACHDYAFTSFLCDYHVVLCWLVECKMMWVFIPAIQRT